MKKIRGKGVVFAIVGVFVVVTFASVASEGVLKSNDYFQVAKTKSVVKACVTQKTIVVPRDYPTIQQAINHAKDGDTIRVWRGTYKENIVVNKMLNIMGNGSSVTIIDGGGSGNVVEITADGVEISGFTIKGSGIGGSGIYVSSHYNTIQRNMITMNGYGLKLDASSGNQIKNNDVIENNIQGLWLYRSHANTISGNTIAENGNSLLLNSSFVSSKNVGIGVMINFSSIGNSFEGNTISNNEFIGIAINETSRSNSFIGNGITGNQFGVKGLGASDNNIYHHNDLLDNSQNAFDTNIDIWDDGSEGNYWSDYTGEDTDNDGIGDTPHNIPGGNNQDRYPLMNPVRPNRPVINGSIEIKVGESATYHIYTPDPLNTIVCYQVDWSDGSSFQELKDVDPRTGIDVSHAWNDEGIYTVRARAYVDIQGHHIYSRWSPPLRVTVPMNKDASSMKTIIVPKDYSTIQEAIDHANEGDTIRVWAGYYPENIIVNKTLSIIGNSSSDTTIDGKERDDVIRIMNTSNVTLSGFSVINGGFNETPGALGAGVNIEANGCVIEMNYISGSEFGVFMINSSNNTISRNRLEGNNHGVNLFYSKDIDIENNSFYDEGLGIYGDELGHFLHKIEGNKINGIDLLYVKNKDGMHLDGIEDVAGSIIFANCNNIIVERMNRLSSAEMGIESAFCSNITIEKCTFSYNDFGIYVYKSTENVVIKNNTFLGNRDAGIYLKESTTKIKEDNFITKNSYGIRIEESLDNLVEGNRIYENNQTGVFLQGSTNNIIRENEIRYNANGVDIYSSLSNKVRENNISNNQGNGIYIQKGERNEISYNDIIKSGKNGVELRESSENHIVENFIASSEFYGIRITDKSDGNIIYHNNLFFNGIFYEFWNGNAWDECNNVWNLTYHYPPYSTDYGGNYWSDHPCIDRMQGPNQSELGEDGICDSKYYIPGGNNIDYYPLVPTFGDKTPPKVRITEPQEGFLYWFGIPFDWRLESTVIVGPKIIVAQATDQGHPQSDAVKVEFRLLSWVTGDNAYSVIINHPPFTWPLKDCNKILFGPYQLQAIATDAAGNENRTNMDIWIFYIPWLNKTLLERGIFYPYSPLFIRSSLFHFFLTLEEKGTSTNLDFRYRCHSVPVSTRELKFKTAKISHTIKT